MGTTEYQQSPTEVRLLFSFNIRIDMQYEARKFLEKNIIERAIIEASKSVTDDYNTDMSREVKACLAIERTEGHLNGVYRFWCIMNDEELTDDHKKEITDMVTKRGEQIKKVLAKAEEETSPNYDQPSVFDT